MIQKAEHTGHLLAASTEFTARSVMPCSGRDDKHLADHIAVEAMRKSLDELDLNLHILLGEGEKDDAPMLYSGECLGKRKNTDGPRLDLVVDPLECTTNFARGLPDSMSVILAAPSGNIQEVPGTYMEQILVPPDASDLLGKEITLDKKPAEILPAVAKSVGISVTDITVVVQDRPRHKDLIAQIRATGAGVGLIESGSISAGHEIINENQTRWTMLWGTFGAPEGLIIAFMARASGYGFLGRVAPHNDTSRKAAEDLGISGRSLREREWIRSDSVLVLSGIHSSTWMPGVRSLPDGRKKVTTFVWTEGRREVLEHVNGDPVSIVVI